MEWHYLAYGLHLRANARLPGMQPLQTTVLSKSTQADLDIRLQIPISEHVDLAPFRLYYESPEVIAPHQAPTLRIYRDTGRQRYRWLYCDGIEFLIDLEAATILVSWPPGETLEGAATYLLNPILGFVLRLRATICLHASAIVGQNAQGAPAAIALLGPEGSGKSTTAAAFARLGYPVLTDDIIALTGQDAAPLVQPGIPRIRLWPPAVQMLFGAPDALPLLVPASTCWPGWDKRYLDLNPARIAPPLSPVPLQAIYILGLRQDNPHAPFVEPVTATRALITLITNTYMNSMLDRPLRAHEFDYLARLVQHIPIRHLTPHTDPARLDHLCQVVIHDFQALTSVTSLFEAT